MTARTAYIGTFADGDTDGIYRVSADRETGALTVESSVSGGEAPSFLALHPTHDRLYAVNTVDAGTIRSFAIDGAGALEALDVVETGRGAPCYCQTDATGAVLLAAHYGGACVSATALDDDGRLTESIQIVEHEGDSVDPNRQTEPHPHSILPGWENEVAYAADLGTDEVVVYDLDPAAATLERRDAVAVHDGAGPRHMAYHPSGDFLYLINEIDSTITTFERAADGGLTVQDTVETLPSAFDGDSTTAHVAVHPSGEYLYGSNRGHDSITVFELSDPAAPAPLQHVSTGGEWPRHFALAPDGGFCYVEHRHTDDVIVFDVEESTGELSATGDRVSLPEPVCMQFR
jgi:6-phosphogluconolactonase